MATSKERQIARDKKLDEAVIKIDKILELLEASSEREESKEAKKVIKRRPKS